MEKHIQQEVNYRLSKWLIWNAGIEQLLTPDGVENVFRELLSFYCSHDCYIEHRFGHRTPLAQAE